MNPRERIAFGVVSVLMLARLSTEWGLDGLLWGTVAVIAIGTAVEWWAHRLKLRAARRRAWLRTLERLEADGVVLPRTAYAVPPSTVERIEVEP